MARTDAMTGGMPEHVIEELRTVGRNLRAARKARDVTMDQMAGRMMVTAPTLRKLERGDPTVSVGNLVMAMWALDLSAPDIFPVREGLMPKDRPDCRASEPLPKALADDNF